MGRDLNYYQECYTRGEAISPAELEVFIEKSFLGRTEKGEALLLMGHVLVDAGEYERAERFYLQAQNCVEGVKAEAQVSLSNLKRDHGIEKAWSILMGIQLKDLNEATKDMYLVSLLDTARASWDKEMIRCALSTVLAHKFNDEVVSSAVLFAQKTLTLIETLERVSVQEPVKPPEEPDEPQK